MQNFSPLVLPCLLLVPFRSFFLAAMTILNSQCHVNLFLEATCLHALTRSFTQESNIDPHAKLTLDMTLWCPAGWSCLQNARALAPRLK